MGVPMKRNVKRHAVTQPLDQSIKLIALTKGQTMKVSAHRYGAFMQHSWYALKGQNIPGYYAATKVWRDGKYHTIYAHRFVLGLEAGNPFEGDHKNHDTLDNTDGNIRHATRTQQLQNTKHRKNNTSGHKGISWHKASSRWRACLNVEGRQKSLGYFLTYEEAVAVYVEAVPKYFGEFACL